MAHEQETVYLVDGSSYIHRAYHAIRQLSNSKGFPTNAVLGFCKMILRLLDEKKPLYAAIAFDAKGPTFRHEMYRDYKANRPPMPEDLVLQIPYIHAVVRGLNVMSIERSGYEADDILGTLARIWEAKGHHVVIVTGDKDFRQLITPAVSLWDTMKGKVTDYGTFKEEYGMEPSQVIDMMGLSGDSSDNIPGVPGVGEKTAIKLIREFGTLEQVFEHLDKVRGKKLKENLGNSLGNALLSKKLVTIDQFVPLDSEETDLGVGQPLVQELTDIFHELEFRGLWDQFATRKEPREKHYHLCLSEEKLKDLIERIVQRGAVSIDTETTGTDPLRAHLVGISFCLEEGTAYYLPLAHSYLGVPEQLGLQKALEMLRGVLEDGKILKIGQNIKYDALVLRNHGVELRGLYFDTMVASYVINPSLRQHNLEYLAQQYLNHKMISYQEVVGKGRAQVGFGEVEINRAMEYSCEDADITLQLMGVLEEQLKEDGNEELFHSLEMRLIPVLVDMEWHGIKVDTGFFRTMSSRIADQLKGLEKEIYDEAGMEFNIKSSQQLGYVLFEKLELPAKKKTAKTKAYSTDVKVLKELSALPYKMPKLLLRYRTLSKLKSTYLDALVKIADPKTSRIHTSYNQTVAATGRLSSSNPNLQNIPIRGEEGREIRKGFVAEEGHKLLSADYSQVELRVFAHYSKDEAFLEAFRRDEDIHSRTAAEILDVEPDAVTQEQRRIAKAINFGIIYGMGPRKLSEELGIDLKTARNYIETYYERYQGVRRYREEMLEVVGTEGFVTTLFNRKRYLPHINHDQQRIRAEAERMAINTPIQGTAADLIKKAMIQIQERLGREHFKAKMLLQVHDELVFEVPDAEVEALGAMVKEEMEEVYPLLVPLKVDSMVGKNWDEAH